MATAITEQKVLDALHKVMDPELNHSVVELGFIQDVDIVGDFVHLDIQLTTPHCPFADRIVDSIRGAVAAIPGVREVEVERTCLKDA